MRTLIACTALIAAAAIPAAAQGVRETVLRDFRASPTDAMDPSGALLRDTSGRLYGVSQSGGAANLGAIYRLTPPAAAGGAWTEDVLFSFHGKDGTFPIGSLIMDAQGSLYGVTFSGGIGYGTGPSGGNGEGLVYKLTPPALRTGRWTQTILYEFTGRADGSGPTSGLLLTAGGILYGTAETGGDPLQSCGVAYALSPPPPGAAAWTQTVIYTFDVAPGCSPQGPLIADHAGLLYGTAKTLGPSERGLVFALKPPAAGSSVWSEQVVYGFAGGAAGYYPNGGLASAPDGTLFGTTLYGGNLSGLCAIGGGGCGTVFELTPPAPGSASWTETQIFAFDAMDGRSPTATVIRDAQGNLYGTTSGNGHYGHGVAYKLLPPAAGGRSWTQTIHKFGNSAKEGLYPYAPLIFGPKGIVYGITAAGGANGGGTAFSLKQ